MKRVTFVLIGAMLLVSACGELVEIGGVIIDADTRRPIPGAIVTLSVYDRRSAPDTTAADGSYFVSTIATGVACGVPPVRITVTHPGYETRREIYAGTQKAATIALRKSR